MLRIVLATCFTLLLGFLPCAKPGERPFKGRSLKEWGADLRERDQALRLAAVSAIGEFGDAAAPYIPDLVQAAHPGRLVSKYLMEQESPEEYLPRRKAATISLQKIGGKAEVYLLKQMQDADAHVRKAAIVLFGECGFRSKEAIQVLMAAVQGKAMDESQLAIAALKDIRSSLPDGAKSEELSPAVPVLIEQLQSPSFKTRETCCRALAVFGAEAKAASPVLTKLLDDKAIGFAAVEALWRIEPKTRASLLERVFDHIRSKKEEDYLRGTQVLSRIQPEETECVPRLAAALKDPHENVRYWAAKTLGHMGSAAKAAIPALIDALAQPGKKRHITPRYSGTDVGPGTFGGFGGSSREKKPTLVNLFRLELSTPRDVLASMGKTAQQSLLQRLSEPESPKHFLLLALAAFGRQGSDGLPLVMKCFLDESALVKRNAIIAAWHIDPGGMQSADALASLLKDKDEKVRLWALASLSERGKHKDAALAAGSELLRAKDAMVRSDAASALSIWGAEATSALLALKAAAKDPSLYVRQSVASAVRWIEADAKRK